MNYFWLIIKHKWFVFIAGKRLGVPLYLLILHDWSKFSWCELPHYQRQFFGDGSDTLGFSYCWNHHQKANKHHFEYWIPITGHNRGGYPDMKPLPMPLKYVLEMIADWQGASRAYEGKWPDKNWNWWEKNRTKILSHCHTDTADLLNEYLATGKG